MIEEGKQEEEDARNTPEAHSDCIGEAERPIWGRVGQEGSRTEASDSEYYNRGVEGPLARIQGERSP